MSWFDNHRGLADRLTRVMTERCPNGTREMAEKAGVRHSVLDNVMAGRKTSRTSLDKVCEAYRVDPNWLYLGKGEQPYLGEPGPDLAATIEKVSEGMTKLLASGLNRGAIVVLLRDKTRVSKRAIEKVLDGLSKLAEDYTR